MTLAWIGQFDVFFPINTHNSYFVMKIFIYLLRADLSRLSGNTPSNSSATLSEWQWTGGYVILLLNSFFKLLNFSIYMINN